MNVTLGELYELRRRSKLLAAMIPPGYALAGDDADKGILFVCREEDWERYHKSRDDSLGFAIVPTMVPLNEWHAEH